MARCVGDGDGERGTKAYAIFGAFDANAVVTLDPYIDLLGKYFKTPKEGLGNDNSPVAHMWRTIAMPDTAL